MASGLRPFVAVNATHFSRSIETPLVEKEADDTQKLDDAHQIRVQPKT